MNNISDNELQKAIALFYDGNHAPVVTAKGIGREAEEIIRVAEEAGVPLCDNAPLVELLAQLELGDSIPESLYIAIAHIIAFAYKLQWDISSGEEVLPGQR